MKTVHRVAIRNFLSFRDCEIFLNDLTVLVGANGSGKTNFLRVFQFIGEMARTDLFPAIQSFGGYDHIRFRGHHRGRSTANQYSSIELEGLMTHLASQRATDTYRISFRPRPVRNTEDLLAKERRSILNREEAFIFKRTAGRGRRITLKGRELSIARMSTAGDRSRGSETGRMSVQGDASGLALLRRLGEDYEAPQVDELADVFEGLRLFEVDVEAIRRPPVKTASDRLYDNAANLAEHLAWMNEKHPHLVEIIEDDVRHVLPSFDGFVFTPLENSDRRVRLEIQERNLRNRTPLARVSYGTIRAIALFTMLQDPKPPKLTCMEEVDHGLHPYALDRLVERMRQASSRTQIIVATHSPALVNRLTPDELQLFERDFETGETIIPDITADEVEEMERESGLNLGELWFSGMLGDMHA